MLDSQMLHKPHLVLECMQVNEFQSFVNRAYLHGHSKISIIPTHELQLKSSWPYAYKTISELYSFCQKHVIYDIRSIRCVRLHKALRRPIARVKIEHFLLLVVALTTVFAYFIITDEVN